MARLAALSFDDDPDSPTREGAEPQVFVRTFAIPAGLPWDQGRAARLEARHGAPLPIVELNHRLKRMGGWAPGRAGQFAVFYVRKADVISAFETTVDVDGEPVRVAFGVSANRLPRLRALGVIVAAGMASVLLLGAAGVASLTARAQATQRLETLEATAAAKLRLARRAQAARDQSARLAKAQGQASEARDVLADLAWLAQAKTPDARIVAVHWDRGLIAIEARGPAAPVGTADRQVVRATRPVRPGVWLWGIARDRGAGPQPQGLEAR